VIMWQDLWPWLLGAVVVFLGGLALWLALRRPATSGQAGRDESLDAIQLWLDGRLEEARDLLREVVRSKPADVEPYLHLGTLCRLTGDPGRAAALHRSLAVRPGLSQARRVTVGLELAADLVDLERWQDAGEVLDQLAGLARRSRRWHRLRFDAAVGLGDHAAALKALRHGEKHLDKNDAADMRSLRAAWVTDRAVMLARSGDTEGARSALSGAKGLAEAAGRIHLVRALIAAHEHDGEKAVRSIERGLVDHPADMAPALRTIEGVLADAGHFLRVVPILEEACRREDAPPQLWMALARLYEKLDRREDAIRLLAGKRGDPRLTPDSAAPYLRLLTAGAPEAGFTRVWNLLGDPVQERRFVCPGCGRREQEIRWFCPDCGRHDDFERRCGRDLEPEAVVMPATLDEPPRY